MLNVRERDLNLSEGFIVIPHPKEKKPKVASLLALQRYLMIFNEITKAPLSM
jgi:hypothetical protein